MNKIETSSEQMIYSCKSYTLARVTLRGIGRAMRSDISLQSFTVREGRGFMNVDGEMYELRPGKTIDVMPNQAYQQVSDQSAGDLVLLARAEPPTREGRLEEVDPLMHFSFSDELTLASQPEQVVI